jgi:hypothetical protein
MNAREVQLKRAGEAPCIKCGIDSPFGEHSCMLTYRLPARRIGKMAAMGLTATSVEIDGVKVDDVTNVMIGVDPGRQFSSSVWSISGLGHLGGNFAITQLDA